MIPGSQKTVPEYDTVFWNAANWSWTVIWGLLAFGTNQAYEESVHHPINHNRNRYHWLVLAIEATKRTTESLT